MKLFAFEAMDILVAERAHGPAGSVAMGIADVCLQPGRRRSKQAQDQ